VPLVACTAGRPSTCCVAGGLCPTPRRADPSAPGPPSRDFRTRTGRVRYFGPRYVHQVRNVGSVPAVSVHVHAPRLTVMNPYRVEDGRLLRIGAQAAGADR
jgi:hypothetical protein